MSFNVNMGYGIQRLLDASLRWQRSGYPVYYRVRNFADVQNTDWAQLGFTIAPTGGQETGTTDTLIDPPPSVHAVSVHNIGQSTGKLRFGAKIFTVTASFTDDQVAQWGYADEQLVWKHPRVIGLVSGNLLFSIEDIVSEQIAGKTISWLLTCNANELK